MIRSMIYSHQTYLQMLVVGGGSLAAVALAFASSPIDLKVMPTSSEEGRGALEVKLNVEGKPCINQPLYLVAEPNSAQRMQSTFKMTMPDGKQISSSGFIEMKARTEFTPVATGKHTLTVGVADSTGRAYSERSFNVKNCY